MKDRASSPSADPLVQALQSLVKKTKGGYKAVAQEIGANDQSLYQVITCRPDSKTGRTKSVGKQLRDKLDEHYPDWLATGDGNATPAIETSRVKLSGVDPLDLVGGGVPLISWVQAGCWADVSDPHQLGEADDWLPCPVRHGPRTYCLRVRGDSMNNPGGRPSYADGDIIFVDPDRDAKQGDRVVVRLDDHQEATFKQLLIEDGRKLLKALNPEWAPRYVEINGNATMAGVVIGKWVPE